MTTLFLLMISPAVGSFLGVLVDRLPRGEDVVVKPSSCRNCQQRLRPLELIPVASFVLRKGRCHTCGFPIPRVLVILEIAAILCVIIAHYVALTPLETIISAVFLWLLLGLAVSDALWFRLPDVLTGSLLVCGFGVTFLNPARDLGNHFAAAALGVAVFIGLRWGYARLRGVVGLGLGDVKLMAGIGMVVGLYALPHTLLVASSAALIYALFQAWRLGMPINAATRLPFGSFLCLATGLVWFAQRAPFFLPLF